MAQLTFSDDQKAGYDALAAVVATLSAGVGLSRMDDVMSTAALGEYTPTTPGAFVLITTAESGEAAIAQYADLSALQTAVAAMT